VTYVILFDTMNIQDVTHSLICLSLLLLSFLFSFFFIIYYFIYISTWPKCWNILFPITESSVFPKIGSVVESSVVSEDYAHYWILGNIRWFIQPSVHTLPNPQLCQWFPLPTMLTSSSPYKRRAPPSFPRYPILII
jgi:hypothetical protein